MSMKKKNNSPYLEFSFNHLPNTYRVFLACGEHIKSSYNISQIIYVYKIGNNMETLVKHFLTNLLNSCYVPNNCLLNDPII